MTFAAIMSPIRIGRLDVPNRVARAAHLTQYTSRGRVTDKFVAYHAARAAGGVGLSILESATVDRAHSPAPLDASSDAVIDGWRQVADAVHAHGMRVFAQLYHGGNQVAPGDGSAPWSASTVPGWGLGLPAVAMSTAMIQHAVAAFAAAAVRARASGLDGVELHGAHGYLIAQFLSPLTNHRTDAYGGPLANRLRFALDCLRAVRHAVGADYPVGIRLSGNEWLPGGLTSIDCVAIAQAIDASGLVDFIDVTAGVYQSMHKVIGSTYEAHGYELADSVRVARAVAAPCIVTGRITELAHADAIVARGDAAMVSMVRATIADANLVRRTLAGHSPRPCIGCLQGCFGGLFVKDMGCTVNASVGLETTLPDAIDGISLIGIAEPAISLKRVLVIGAGPAGLEAARVAALRGHDVLLCERSDTLGGQLRWAARTPGRADMGRIVGWLEAEVRRLGVRVRTGVAVHAESIAALGRFDDVIVATGPRQRGAPLQLGRPALVIDTSGTPPVPFLTSSHLLSGAVMPPAGPVVVLDDVGHIEGLGICEWLVDAGCVVTAVTRYNEMASQVLPPFASTAGREHLARSSFTLRPRSFVAAARNGCVTVSSLDGGPDVQVAAQALVTVTFDEPDTALGDALADALAAAGSRVHLVGDARTQRFLTTAIHEGHRVARNV